VIFVDFFQHIYDVIFRVMFHYSVALLLLMLAVSNLCASSRSIQIVGVCLANVTKTSCRNTRTYFQDSPFSWTL